MEHINEVDNIVSNWIQRHDLSVVLEQFEKAEAAIGPAYNIAQIFEDPQYQAREDIIELKDEDLGSIKMANAFPYMSGTPAKINHAGPRKGQHNREILIGELGVSEEELVQLEEDGII